MQLLRISLTNYRNFKEFQLDFSSPNTILVAPNASGKSNLLEAIFMLSYPKPLRDIRESDLISWHSRENWARITGDIQDGRAHVLEIFLQKSEENRTSKVLQLNGIRKRGVDFIGNFFAILFSPITLNILILSPSIRRSFLDRTLSSLVPDYTSVLNDYTKIVKSKNKVLDTIRKGNASREELHFWNTQMLILGNRITWEREQFVADVNAKLVEIGKPNLTLFYKANVLDDMQKYFQREIEAGRCLVGPHRDDWELHDDKRNLALFGSRGEQRMGILYMQFSLFNLLSEKREKPVLLLDDVTSELDRKNMGILNEMIDVLEGQTIITSTSGESFTQRETCEMINLKESILDQS